MEIQTIFELHSDNNKSKYSKDILKFAKKKKNEKLHIKQTEFLSKIPNIKKISNEHFNLCEAEISLDEIIKFR